MFLYVLLIFNRRMFLYVLLIFNLILECSCMFYRFVTLECSCSCMFYWFLTLELSCMFYWFLTLEFSCMFYWFLTLECCCMFHIRNKSWQPEYVLSFNMGWWILVFYPIPGARDKIYYYTLCKFLTLSIHFIGQATFVNFH